MQFDFESADVDNLFNFRMSTSEMLEMENRKMEEKLRKVQEMVQMEKDARSS